MTVTSNYDPTLFAGVAQYYRKYRPRYTDELYQLLIKEFKLDGRGRLLDLGTGTGLIAISLSTQFTEVIGLDPDREMLQEALQEAELNNIKNIRWIHDMAENISTVLGEFHLATIGRAYHWMDKAKVLQLVNDRLVPNGGIAITYTYEDIWHSSEPWKQKVLAVVKKYLGEKRRTGAGTIENLDATYADLPELLQRSGFTAPVIHKIAIEKTWTIDSWIGYLYSTAFCRPDYFGDRITQFEQEMRDTLLAIAPTGEFIERIPVDVYLAHKN
ncbi:MAG: class I SAM-dependent methyltransferase [Pseudanabaena frigida]|uniref:Class I SAM-dependent methyltransferase n=1 Tax=Pseudanabaena frigida TaxID=945775 RepID=A0A2W4W169_9CYAN|nr:MAG: class I SAM-dependent methyltransferase [Pseudanabaena frigida]